VEDVAKYHIIMNKLKSIWTTITGSISSVIPLFFACCKSGACVGVCASPITSLLGISTAGFMASPIFGAFVPVLLVLSAVSFTMSYYDLYVLPKLTSCATDCDCNPEMDRQKRISKWIFWIGLIASTFFFTYFEVQKYQTEKSNSIKTEELIKRLNSHPNSVDSTEVSPCCASGSKCDTP
jgi:hypothetical protein